MMLLNGKTGNYDSPSESAEFYFASSAYLYSVSALINAYRADERSQLEPLANLPIYQNVNHVLELILKTYLSIDGVNKTKLIKFGHALRPLLDECISRNIQLFDDFKNVVIQEHWMHEGHRMRYFDNQKWYVFSNLENVIPIIRTQFADLSKKFTKIQGWKAA